MPSRLSFRLGRTALLASLLLGAAGCSWIDRIGSDEEGPAVAGASAGGPGAQMTTVRQNSSGVAGMTAAARPAAGQAVNAYLWRAALDTLQFMPIQQADAFGGVILTDWYSPPATPSERFKINLYILDAALRADGVRATVFRQVDQNGSWRDAPVAPETATQLEDSILTRARQLRQAAAVTR